MYLAPYETERRSQVLAAKVTALPSEFTRPEIARAMRSWLTESGRGIDKTGLTVRASRVHRPDKICSRRLIENILNQSVPVGFLSSLSTV